MEKLFVIFGGEAMVEVLNKGVIWYIVLLIIVIVVWYFYTGFKLPTLPHGSTVSTSTTTVTNTAGTTSVTTNTTATTTIVFSSTCNDLYMYTTENSYSQLEQCDWTGGYLGLWVAAGPTQWEHVKINGADSLTYVNQTSDWACPTFYTNFSAPAQLYTINLTSGPGLPAQNQTLGCNYASAKLNTTLSPPSKGIVYTQVYNGNFTTGAYTGWNVSGKGFGTAPLNISAANAAGANDISCYLGAPWSGYNGNYIATTYNCGTSVAPGNITSSEFYANYPYLNFKIISPQDQFLYVEVLYNGTPYIIAHYDTYNDTQNINYSSQASATFRNASIPLVTVAGLPVQVRVYANTLSRYNFIAAGDFTMGNRAVQDKGILQNLTFTKT